MYSQIVPDNTKIVITMTSREIAELTGKQHGHIMRDISLMLLELKEPVEGYLQDWRHPQNGQTYKEFRLNRELTETLLTGYSALLRRTVIARWHELEAAVATPAIPQTLSAALRLAADQADQIEQQQAALALAAPKVAFVDNYVEATNLRGFREVAKLLKANEARLREFLVAKRIMYRLGTDWMPYQPHLDAGRFEVKTGETNKHAFNRALLTAKGVEWLAGLWAVAQLPGDAA